MIILDHLNFQQILWLVPILFAIHNLEETLLWEKWSKKTPLPYGSAVKTSQFGIAVTFLTIGAFVVTFLGIRNPKNSLGMYLIFAIQAIVFINAFLPHITVLIRFRKYYPGLLTAILINIPFSVYLYQRALAEEFITLQDALILLLVAPVAMIALILVSLKLGEYFNIQQINITNYRKITGEGSK